ncbi:MAG: hypothetical protein V1846_02735 [Candidatus Komeilibacteria bacterium]
MFTAEVLSGASQTWFISFWGLFITFPLYLAQVLFFWWLALRLKKTTLSQLYVFGVIFGLYESWITKVLWSGYFDLGHSLAGTFLGVSIAEFPVLVFFWHPLLSFMAPLLLFELLSGHIIMSHEKIFKKSIRKTSLIIIFLICISTYIAYGNRFNLLSANFSVLGSLLLIWFLSRGITKVNLKIFDFRRGRFLIITSYLLVQYVGSFILLRQEYIPRTILPYISILAFYFMSILLLAKSKKSDLGFISANENHYSGKDLVIFSFILLAAVNAACLMSNISAILFIASYLVFMAIGTALFFTTVYKILRQNFSQGQE